MALAIRSQRDAVELVMRPGSRSYVVVEEEERGTQLGSHDSSGEVELAKQLCSRSSSVEEALARRL